MNKSFGKLTALALSVLLLCTACQSGGTGASSAPSVSSSETTAASAEAPASSADTSVSSTEASTASSGEEISATKTSSDTGSSESQTEESSGDAFSKRDLAGTYDSAQAVPITLNGGSAQCAYDGVEIQGGTVTITAPGTYLLSGSLTDGSIVVNVSKEDKVQLVLNGVTIHSETYAPIYVAQADKVFLTLAEGTVNRLTNGGSFTQRDENTVDAVVFSKDDLTLNGTGTLQLSAPGGHGIAGKDDLVITQGVYEITAAEYAIAAKDSLSIAGGSFTLSAREDGLHVKNSDDDSLGSLYIAGGSFAIQVSDDAIHAESLLEIDGGSFDLTASEGLEATYIRINDGTFQIQASDDGINAARNSSAYSPTVEMNGGDITIVMGAGDTDGVDSNGDIIINGGTISVTGSSSFDYDGSAFYNGGTIIVNGQQVDSIPNQMMGGRGGMGGMGGFPGGNGGFPEGGGI